jgi:hypothetical protein
MSAFRLCTKHLPRVAALALALPLSLPLTAVHAQDVGASQRQVVVPCGRALQAGEWGCFGTMDMRIDGKAYRLAQFSNGDFLAEIEENGRVRHLLARFATHSEQFFGLDESELTFARNPFLFLTDGFAIPVMALHLGFPGGPSTVPAAAATKHVDLWGKPADITASSLSATRVGYRLEFGGRNVSGEYDVKRPEPLRESDLASWGPAQQMPKAPAPGARQP